MVDATHCAASRTKHPRDRKSAATSTGTGSALPCEPRSKDHLKFLRCQPHVVAAGGGVGGSCGWLHGMPFPSNGSSILVTGPRRRS